MSKAKKNTIFSQYNDMVKAEEVVSKMTNGAADTRVEMVKDPFTG
jgi:hypothetical protein